MNSDAHPRLSGLFSGLELHFADFMERLAGGNRPALWLAAALLCRQTSAGHVCLDLPGWAAQANAPATELSIPPLPLWLEQLRETPVVGRPGAESPLILDDQGRLYLNRYWKYENECIEDINKFLSSEVTVNDPLLAVGLAQLFPPPPPGETDWQQVAAAVAVLKRFCIITGGPGSGKTSVVIRVLLLLLEQFPEGAPRILLAAPTGKAAARLRETIRTLRDRIPAAADRLQALPDEVFTLHRLLGLHPLTNQCRYHEGHPLPCDLLVIDEASMVDLPLLVRVLRALPAGARLILLGDRHQLASVEAGAVFSDLCGSRPENSFSPVFRSRLEEILPFPLPSNPAPAPSSPLSDSLVFLTRSYRFDEAGGIGKAAALVRRGEGKALAAFLSGPAATGCRRHPPASPGRIARAIVAGFADHYRSLFESPDPETFFTRFTRFSVLCALRQGPFGAEEFNPLLEKELARRGLIPALSSWYQGRPLMITSNDYRLGLFNGDIGVVFRHPAANRLLAFFPTPEGGMLALSPGRLPAHETAFAMTVHKSQGSEFDAVFLLLPPHVSEVLTRELLYTGLTRARQEAVICASDDILVRTVERRLTRSSGLRDHFRGE